MVEHERCEACGFDGSLLSPDELAGSDQEPRPASGGPSSRRRAPSSASARHRRPGRRSSTPPTAATVTALHVFAVRLALDEDEPQLGEVDGEALIESASASYAEADPAEVAAALERQATELADAAGEAGVSAWGRGLRIGGSRSELRRLLEHGLHDSEHHLDDVERGLGELRAAGKFDSEGR